MTAPSSSPWVATGSEKGLPMLRVRKARRNSRGTIAIATIAISPFHRER